MTANNKILVVDDDPDALSATVRLLKAAGYEVFEATTGQACIAAAQANQPDLVLLDLLLPDINGLEVCAQIKAMPSLAHLFVVLISASQTSSDQQSLGLESGADGYIARPISNRELLARVQALLRIKRAEEALQASEERYRSLVEESPAAIGIYQAGKLVFINSTGVRQFGARTKGDLLGRKAEDLIHPEDQPAALDRIQRRLAGEAGFYPAEVRFLRLDGTAIPVEVTASPITFGGAPAVQFIARDITERKRSEEALRLTRFSMDHASDALFWMTADARVVDVNEAACRSLGYTREELLQLSVPDLDPHYNSEQWSQHFAELRQHGSLKFESEHRTKDGRLISVEITANHVQFGAEERNCSFVRDITGRKRLEEAAKQEQALNRTLVESIPGTFYMIDVNGRYARWNAYQREVIVGKPDSQVAATHALDTIHPDDRQLVSAKIASVLSNGTDETIEARVLLRGGPAFQWMLMTGRQILIQGQPFLIGIGIEITERRRAEAAVRESEARLNEAQSMAHLGSWECDPLTNQLLWSDETYRIFEIPKEGAFASFEAFLEVIHPEDRDAVQAAYAQSLETGKPYETTHRLRLPDGRIKFVLEKCETHYRPDGQAFRSVGIVQDITERKQAEAYRETGREILQILNQPGDLAASIQRVLAALKARTGFDAVGIRLQDGEDFPYFAQEGFPKDFLLAENTLAERGADGGMCRDKEGKVGLECTCGLVISGHTDPANPLFTKGGSAWTNDSFPLLGLPSPQDPRPHPRNRCLHHGYASVALVPIRCQDKIVGLIQLNDRRKGCFSLLAVELLEGIATNLGAALMRKQAEAAVRETNALVSLFIKQSPIFAYVKEVTATESRVLLASQNFHELIGSSATDIVGKSMADLFPAGLARKITEDDRAVIAKGEVLKVDEDLNGRHYSSIKFPILLGGKTLLGGYTIDLTDRKKLEAQLLQSQKQEAIGQLAGGVAHDFNNILAAMMMNISCLEQNPKLDPEIQESLKELLAAAERAASLTRQLLMFSRKSVLDIKVLDLNEVVASLLKMLGRLIGEHIHLQYSSAGELPLVEADRGMMEQVLMNLAVNARDAMPGGGRLAISLAVVPVGAERIKGTVEVRPGTFVCLSVQDTGCGMSQSTLNQIFDPFFTTKDVGQGTGLGLATVSGIAALHKGWVEVESEVGQGTTFRVFLPPTRQRLPEPVQAAKRAVARGRETILLVEDDDAVRRMALRCLTGLGYQVWEAANGRAALKLWQEHQGQIDLLFSDMVMPEGLTGLDLAGKLKADKPDLKVIVSSGYNEDMSGQKTAELKGILYLQKPYKIGLLSKKVRECLDGP